MYRDTNDTVFRNVPFCNNNANGQESGGTSVHNFRYVIKPKMANKYEVTDSMFLALVPD